MANGIRRITEPFSGKWSLFLLFFRGISPSSRIALNFEIGTIDGVPDLLPGLASSHIPNKRGGDKGPK